MPKKVIILFFFILISFFNGHALSRAESSRLALRIEDITWLSCKPYEHLNDVLETLRNTHKLQMSSMVDEKYNGYVTSDPTPAMAWILGIEANKQDRLIGMQYRLF